MSGSSDTPFAGRFQRRSLRQATLILPKTGERVKRAFTLAINRSGSLDLDSQRTPLLGGVKDQEEHSLLTRFKNVSRQGYQFATSRTGQGILKCSLAYVLGSMATFVAPIAALLGRNDGKHMVATITVYFHPARSAGSMEEAIMLAFLAFIYAAFVSFTSMGVSVFFGHHGLLEVGHAIVLFVFCGGALGFVGWLKQKLGKPLVNVACSLTSLAIITILTKEGSVQAAMFSFAKINQVLIMVIMGCSASALVSLMVKPVWARKELQEDMMKASYSLSEMLTMITSSFLSGREEELQDQNFVAASSRYKAVFKSLLGNLSEAKYEHYLLGTYKQFLLEQRLVKCMEQLAQDIGGLRSAATTQFNLIAKSYAEGSVHLPPASLQSTPRSAYFQPLREGHLPAIDEAEAQSSTNSHGEHNVPEWFVTSPDELPVPLSVADMFSLFISHLGPPMKSLAFTLREVLKEHPFESESLINGTFRTSLVDANEMFASARKDALTLLYKHKVPLNTESVEMAADYEEVAASCGHFSSSLQDVAEDMVTYLDILQELRYELTNVAQGRSWRWMLSWIQRKRNSQTSRSNSTSPVVGQAEQGYPQHIADVARRVDKNRLKARSTSRYKLWRVFGVFRRDDIKYALKVGIGAILYAMWSFIPATRPIYSHWRGEWGLLSYMLVCSMTIGASNTTGFHRFLGTCIGALCAVVAWIISDAHAVFLAFFGWLTSLGCFYIILAKGRGPMGRFILLTYNLSALYAYSLSVKDDDDDQDEGGINPEIWEIVLHRVAAVMTGCIWGIIITRLIWPISARRKLQDGVCLLWLRMGIIWRRDPLAILLDEASATPYFDMRESLELKRFLSHLESLCASASCEFELKGPFPEKSFRKILRITGEILDAFYSMNVVIMKDLKASPGERQLLQYTKDERTQLSLRISHLFSVIASSMKLEYPLSDALPNIEHTRDRLLAKTFNFRKHGEGKDIATDEDYELLYAYALVTGQLADNILAVSREIEALYGTLDEDILKLR